MKTINFEIVSKENPAIYQSGYVEVPDCEDELPEWFYYDQSGMYVPRMFTHHEEIGLTQIGATEDQLAELDSFYEALNNQVDFTDDVILNADEEDIHIVYDRDKFVLIVNPDDDWKNTLIRDTFAYIDELPKIPYTNWNRCSVEDVINCVVYQGFDYMKRTSIATATFQKAGDGLCFDVHFGDKEIADAFVKTIEHSATIRGV